jgi:hypothetical protein
MKNKFLLTSHRSHIDWLSSNKPDLIIGTIVFVLVIQGAFRILKLSK